MTARPMDQLDRHTDGTGHPAIAPLDHRDDQRIEIDPFLRQAQISLHLFVSKGLVGVELRRIQRDTRF